MNEHHEATRFDDDGNPHVENCTIRIGIATQVPPAPTQAELDEGMPKPRDRAIAMTAGIFDHAATANRAETHAHVQLPNGDTPASDQGYPKPRLVLPGDDTVQASGGLILPFAAVPEPEPALTWAEYAAWRKTKCPPVDDLARATLELVGEVGELAELLLMEGPASFYGERKAKLIDECGDIFFCACWAIDAWGDNPLVSAGDLEILRVSEGSQILLFTAALANNTLDSVMNSPNFLGPLFSVISELLRDMQMHVALTSNACKKQVYQKRDQDAKKQIGRIGATLLAVNQILVIANSNVEEALISNRTKLDARYPDGWHSNVGGGIRTEG